ncbi:MAG TPA: hypothetical protein VK004_03010 [Ignavibacteria bacterium]|nr:hypothetical protein [Ignavibacteria bacterium]
MNKDIPLVTLVRYEAISRRIKILGFAISLGLIIIYGAGLFVGQSNVNKDMAILNLISIIVCPLICISSVYIRKARLKSVNNENFANTYFGVYIVAFAMCDMGALFCIVTNLFINYNFIYATFGLLVSLLYIWLNFPRRTDMDIINSRSKLIPE